jgi:hypothetical protein
MAKLLVFLFYYLYDVIISKHYFKYLRDNQEMVQEVIFRSSIVLEVVHASGKLHVGLGPVRGDRRVATRPEFVYRRQLAGRPCVAVGEDAR